MAQLDATDIGQQQDVWRHVADLEGRSQAILLEQHPLRAESHSQPEFLCGMGKALIDLACPRRATRHSSNHQRRGEALAEQLCGELHVLGTTLGKSDMGQRPALPGTLLQASLDVLFSDNGQVTVLATGAEMPLQDTPTVALPVEHAETPTSHPFRRSVDLFPYLCGAAGPRTRGEEQAQRHLATRGQGLLAVHQ